MKKALKISSVLCFALAVMALFIGIFAGKVANRSFFMGYAMFNLVRSGGIMGFVGNVFIVVFTVACYGLAGLYGFVDHKKGALIWGALASLLAVVSLISAFANHIVTLGDFIVTAIPIAHTLLVLKSAE